jgi:hypothetical protein
MSSNYWKLFTELWLFFLRVPKRQKYTTFKSGNLRREATVRNCRLPPQFNWILSSSGLLRGVRCFEPDVSGLPIGPIFKGPAVREEPWPLKMGPIGSPETSSSNRFTPRNNPQEFRPGRQCSSVELLSSISHPQMYAERKGEILEDQVKLNIVTNVSEICVGLHVFSTDECA